MGCLQDEFSLQRSLFLLNHECGNSVDTSLSCKCIPFLLNCAGLCIFADLIDFYSKICCIGTIFSESKV